MSSQSHSIIQKLYLSTGIASDPTTHTLFFAVVSEFNNDLNHFTYSFFNLSFSYLCSILYFSLTPKYLYAFLWL